MTHDEPIPGVAVGWVVAATSFGFSLVQLDVTIVNVALPRIAVDLGADLAGLQWVVDAYALVFASMLLSMGFLGDRFGAKRVYLGGIGLFALASLACGLATSAPQLIFGRAVQGIGAAAMLPNSLSLLNHASHHDTKLRAWAIGWWTAASSVAIAAGPIIGGVILGLAGWRMIFLVNLPLCALAAYLTLAMPETARNTSARGFDLAGQVCAILALGGIVGAVIEAKPLGLGHPLVLSLLVVSILAGAGFVVAETRGATPMLPPRLFKTPGFAVCVLYGMAMNLTYYGLVFVLSLYLQRALGYTPVETGFAYLPLTATFFGVNLLGGFLVGRYGARPPMVGGALVDALGFALLLRLGAESSYLAMLPAFALMPGGMGTGVPAMTTAVLASVDKSLSGVAGAVLNAARQAAGAIGVALFGALAGEGRDHIIGGLHASAGVAVVLLLTVVGLAAWGIRPDNRGATRMEDTP